MGGHLIGQLAHRCAAELLQVASVMAPPLLGAAHLLLQGFLSEKPVPSKVGNQLWLALCAQVYGPMRAPSALFQLLRSRHCPDADLSVLVALLSRVHDWPPAESRHDPEEQSRRPVGPVRVEFEGMSAAPNKALTAVF